MNNVLVELRELFPDVTAAAVIGPDGEVLAASARGDLDDVVGPTTTTLTTIAERVAQELGRGSLRSTILEGDFGRVVTRELGEGRILIVVAEPAARLGLLLDDVRACAGRITEVAHA